ncbi:hypothetical protein FRB94_008952 [Tulasnella sp. JGI-2019a]|nr:hypothetical protein FRB93_008566 [Tulasnella sp. JGI-2019a]KAG8995533.1 hypothetical protein FRB94_008952 [Tulasnella sp. JGI-2019a]
MQVAMRVLAIVAGATGNLIMTPIVGRIAAPVNGISATLLVLQLNIFQRQGQDHGTLPLATGPTFQFAAQERSSLSSGGELALAPVPRRRRASASAVVHQSRNSIKDVADIQTPGRLRIAFSQHNVDELPFSDDSTATTLLADKKG